MKILQIAIWQKWQVNRGKKEKQLDFSDLSYWKQLVLKHAAW